MRNAWLFSASNVKKRSKQERKKDHLLKNVVQFRVIAVAIEVGIDAEDQFHVIVEAVAIEVGIDAEDLFHVIVDITDVKLALRKHSSLFSPQIIFSNSISKSFRDIFLSKFPKRLVNDIFHKHFSYHSSIE